MQRIINSICKKSNNNLNNRSYKINNDFENSSEKQCSKMDTYNEKIYSNLLTQAQKAQNAIKNSGLSMNLEVPIPPRPSNRDRYILWKKRNVSKKVIEQSEAILYLVDSGYIYNQHYEAYQAIDLVNELKKKNGESLEYKDSSKNFDNIYNKNDSNILRRRSMHRLSRKNEFETCSSISEESRNNFSNTHTHTHTELSNNINEIPQRSNVNVNINDINEIHQRSNVNVNNIKIKKKPSTNDLDRHTINNNFFIDNDIERPENYYHNGINNTRNFLSQTKPSAPPASNNLGIINYN